MAEVVSVNISGKKGTVKREVPEIQLKLRHGIVGDAHAGDWHRQVSLLAEESVDTMRPLLPGLQPGAFAENINTRGIELKTLPIGTGSGWAGQCWRSPKLANSATATVKSRKLREDASCPPRASSPSW